MSDERFTIRAAVYLILLKEDKILLARRYNTGWMDGKYSLIAGHVEDEESVFDTMIRESEEEAGITIVKENLLPVTVLHRKSVGEDFAYMDYFFVCRKWQGEPIIKEPHKCDEMKWFPLDDLPKDLLPYIVEAIKNYKNNVPFSEYGWPENN